MIAKSFTDVFMPSTVKPLLRTYLQGRWLALILVLVITCSLSAAVRAETLAIAFGEFKPPYIFGQQGRGLEVDIFREALAYRGHNLQVIHIPDRRRYRALGDNKPRLDGVATIGKGNGEYFYSDDFISYENYVISRKEDDLSISSVRDLQVITVVAWQNAWAELGEPFRRLFAPDTEGSFPKNYYEHPSQRAQVEMFWRKRIDAVVMDRKIFYWLSRYHLGKEEFASEVVFHSLFVPRTSFRAAFIREQIRDDFNAGLAWLKKTGRYRRLVDRYKQ